MVRVLRVCNELSFVSLPPVSPRFAHITSSQSQLSVSLSIPSSAFHSRFINHQFHKILCFLFVFDYRMFDLSVFYVFLQYFDTVGWVF